MSETRFTSLAHCRKPDGRWDGAATMATITGLSREEVVWTWERLSLLLGSGMEKTEAMRLVKEQAKEKPWNNPPSVI